MGWIEGSLGHVQCDGCSRVTKDRWLGTNPAKTGHAKVWFLGKGTNDPTFCPSCQIRPEYDNPRSLEPADVTAAMIHWEVEKLPGAAANAAGSSSSNAAGSSQLQLAEDFAKAVFLFKELGKVLQSMEPRMRDLAAAQPPAAASAAPAAIVESPPPAQAGAADAEHPVSQQVPPAAGADPAAVVSADGVWGNYAAPPPDSTWASWQWGWQ